MSFGFAVYVRFPLTKVRISERQTKLIKFIFNCVHLFVTLAIAELTYARKRKTSFSFAFLSLIRNFAPRNKGIG